MRVYFEVLAILQKLNKNQLAFLLQKLQTKEADKMKISKQNIITALSMLIAHYTQAIEYYEENEIPYYITDNAVLRLKSHKYDYEDFQLDISLTPFDIDSDAESADCNCAIKIFDHSVNATVAYFELNCIVDNNYYCVADNAQDLIFIPCNFAIKRYFNNMRQFEAIFKDSKEIENFTCIDDLNGDDYYLAYCFTIFENPVTYQKIKSPANSKSRRIRRNTHNDF